MSNIPTPLTVFNKTRKHDKVSAYNKLDNFDERAPIFTQDENRYRSFVHFNKENRDALEAILLDWLKEKLGIEHFEAIDESPWFFHEFEERQFAVRIEVVESSDYLYKKIHFFEKFFDDNETLKSPEQREVELEVILGYSEHRNWMWTNIQIISNFSNPYSVMASRPRFIMSASHLLSIKDSQFFHPLGRQHIVSDNDVHQFISYLLSSERGLPVVVVAEGESSDEEHQSFQLRIEHWEKAIRGVTSFFIIDKNQVQKVNEYLSEYHVIRPWSVRTFMPQIQLHDEQDSGRHKWLSHKSIVESKGAWSSLIIGRAARLGVNVRRVPKAIRTANVFFSKKHNHELLNPVAVTAQKQKTDEIINEQLEPRQYLAECLKSDFNLDVSNDDHVLEILYAVELKESLQERDQEIEKSLNQKDEKIRKLEIAVEEHETLLTQRDNKIDEQAKSIKRLEFKAQEDALKLAALEEPDESNLIPPVNYSELAAYMNNQKLPDVIYTGVESAWEDYFQYDPNNALITKIWRSMLALQKYCDYKKSNNKGSLFEFIGQGLAPGLSKEMYAAKESETTRNSKLSKLRLLPVPKSVNKNGKVQMDTHLKFKGTIGGDKQLRIHFYDNTSNKGDGKVYIGYMGPHLTIMGSH